MIEPSKMLLPITAMLVAVAAGLVTTVWAALRIRVQQTGFLRVFLMQNLFFNLLILVGFIYRSQDGADGWLLLTLLTLLTLLKLAWLYFFAVMMLELPEGKPRARLRLWFPRGAALILALLLAALTWAQWTDRPGIVGVVLGVTEMVVFGGAATAAILLIVRSSSLPRGMRQRSLIQVGLAYLTTFVVMAGSLALAWARDLDRQADFVLFTSLFMTLYNLLPWVWVVRLQPLAPVSEDTRLDQAAMTARERQILELISAGCTNQEIADRLFISLATVKDHNTNIFRKAGVRNRVQLINWLRGRS